MTSVKFIDCRLAVATKRVVYTCASCSEPTSSALHEWGEWEPNPFQHLIDTAGIILGLPVTVPKPPKRRAWCMGCHTTQLAEEIPQARVEREAEKDAWYFFLHRRRRPPEVRVKRIREPHVRVRVTIPLRVTIKVSTKPTITIERRKPSITIRRKA